MIGGAPLPASTILSFIFEALAREEEKGEGKTESPRYQQDSERKEKEEEQLWHPSLWVINRGKKKPKTVGRHEGKKRGRLYFLSSSSPRRKVKKAKRASETRLIRGEKKEGKRVFKFSSVTSANTTGNGKKKTSESVREGSAEGQLLKKEGGKGGRAPLPT